MMESTTAEQLTAKIERIEALVKSGDFEQAETQARELLAVLPESAAEAGNPSDKDFELENHLDKAGQVLHKQNQENSLRARAYLLLGKIAHLCGNYHDALEQYASAQNISQAQNDQEKIAKAMNNIGLVYTNLSEYPNALEYFQNALLINEKLGNKDGSAANLGNLGNVYRYLSEYTKALTYIQKALSIFEDLGNKDSIANNLANIGMVYRNLSEYTKALEYIQKALAVYEEIGSKVGIARNLGNIGIVYQNLGDYSRALEYYQQALASSEEIGLKDGIAQNLSNIGAVYWDLSEYANALTYCQKSLAIFEEIGSKSGIANNLASIGLVYRCLSEYDNSLRYYQKSLSIFEELGSEGGIAINLGNIGNLYVDISEYSNALTYLQKALTLNEKLGNKNGIAINLGNIGNVYGYLSEYSNALKYLQKALAINEEIGKKEGIARDLANIGTTYAKKEFDGYDAAKSEEFLLKAIAMCEEIGAKQHLYETRKILAELYEHEKRDSEALVQFKKFYETEKEVQSEEAKKQAQLMEQQRQIAIAKAAADAKHQATQELLHNVLPPSIAHRMVAGEKLIAEKLPSVSVLFADIVGFTKLSQRITAEELVEGLDTIFSSFDILAEKHGLEKIKTIGDAYMVVSGAPEPRTDHAEAMAEFALDMVEAMKEFTSKTTGEKIQLRIGIHSGEVVAGVIGKKKFAYDLWGDAVNTASRMESHGEAGKIHISDDFRTAVETCRGVSPLTIEFIERGEMEIKGKGMMKTYFLTQSN